MKINGNFADLKENYLFAEVAKRVAAFKEKYPERSIIKMGIGDVTLPLSPSVVDAIKKGASELGVKETFKGYPDYEGYKFVRDTVCSYYAGFGVNIDPCEVFISDGAKSDCGNIGDIFDKDNTVLVADPVYPVYVDSNIMAGRRIIYAKAGEWNNFCALPDRSVKADIIYICSPNNPTGSAYTKEQLKEWVDYANENDAVILYDSAYEAFIIDDLPRSIFDIEGARTCAIEFCSLSKTAGFTGTRCGYTVIPNELVRGCKSLNRMWYRRQATKFNGVSWPIQCAAAAALSPEGQKQNRINIDYYRENAGIMTKTLDSLGIYYTGGRNSPYIWLKCPDNMASWEFFELLLNEIGVVGTPGEGFGECGKGYFRLTAFSSREQTEEAMQRFYKLFSK